eukprot:COSAG01_NODE_9064_length_2564_cov_2.841849_5_plen_119_part_00
MGPHGASLTAVSGRFWQALCHLAAELALGDCLARVHAEATQKQHAQHQQDGIMAPAVGGGDDDDDDDDDDDLVDGESFLRVHWVAVPKALRARRPNNIPQRVDSDGSTDNRPAQLTIA